MSDRASHEATIRRMLTAVAERDRESLAACLAADVAWWMPQSAGERGLDRPVRDRDQVASLLTGGSGFEPDSAGWDVHRIVDDGEFVAVYATMTARTRTGKDYSNEYMSLYRFDGEHVAEAWEHTDTAYAFDRLSG